MLGSCVTTTSNVSAFVCSPSKKHDVAKGLHIHKALLLARKSKCNTANRSLTVALCLAKLSQSVAARSSTRVPGPHSFHFCGVSGHASANPLTGVAKERATAGRPVHSRFTSGCRVLVLKCALRRPCGWSLLLYGAWHKAWPRYDATGIQAHDTKRFERLLRHKCPEVFDGADAAQRGQGQEFT